MTARGRRRCVQWYSSTPSLTSALEWSSWSTPRLGRLNAEKEARYRLYRRLGGPRGWSGQVRSLATTGIRSSNRPARSEFLYRPNFPGRSSSTSYIKTEFLPHAASIEFPLIKIFCAQYLHTISIHGFNSSRFCKFWPDFPPMK